MSTIDASAAQPSFDDYGRHVVLDGVERGARWRRGGRLPEAGAVVDLVPSLHPDRLNVVDDQTLELLGSIPRNACRTFAQGGDGRRGVVISARNAPRPVVVIAVR